MIAERPILLVGAGGMLGSHLREAAAAMAIPLIAASSRAGAAHRFDLLCDDPERWLDGLPTLPGAAIVCSAQSNIDTCRRDPQGSNRLNVDATGKLFRALSRRGIHTVFFSSDMVFAGDAGGYAEDDPCRPTTEYGRQKRAAELALLEAGGSALIVRLGKLYARDARDTSPLSGWYRAWSVGMPTRCARDQWLMPTWAGDVAAVTLELVAQQRRGVIHVVAPEAFTRLGLAQALVESWGFNGALVEDCSIGDFAFAEPRPLNNCLSGDRLKGWLPRAFFPVRQLQFDSNAIEGGVI